MCHECSLLRLLLLSNNEKITISESKATTLQSKLSKLELKADLFLFQGYPTSRSSFTNCIHSFPDLLSHRHSLNELRYGLELSIYPPVLFI